MDVFQKFLKETTTNDVIKRKKTTESLFSISSTSMLWEARDMLLSKGYRAVPIFVPTRQRPSSSCASNPSVSSIVDCEPRTKFVGVLDIGSIMWGRLNIASTKYDTGIDWKFAETTFLESAISRLLF